MKRPANSAVVIAIVAACAAIGSIVLPWITAGIGTDPATYSGTELPPAAVPVVVAAIVTVVLSLASLREAPGLRPYAAAASGLGALVAAVMIGALETVALLVPGALLPDTVERSGFALGAGYGLWLALASMAIATIAMHAGLSTTVERRLRLPSGHRAETLALLCLGALTLFVGWLRYRAWIDASLVEKHLELPAWVAPWIGPLSLLSVWMLASALVLGAFLSGPLPGLVAAAAGWLTATIAAFVVVAVGAIGKLGLEATLSTHADAAFGVTRFVWFSFAAGLVAAAVGASLIQLNAPRRDSRPWRS